MGAGDDAGEEEATRQADLGRLRALATEYASAAGRRGERRRVPRRARAPVRGRARGPRRAAHDLPPSEGARVRRGVPAAAARRRAPVPSAQERGRPRRGTAPVVRGHHARARAPVPVVAARGAVGAEPVPAGDRRGASQTAARPAAAARARPQRRVTVSGAGGAPLFDRLQGVAPQARSSPTGCPHTWSSTTPRSPRSRSASPATGPTSPR